jgi:hypothetical protein
MERSGERSVSRTGSTAAGAEKRLCHSIRGSQYIAYFRSTG